MTLLRRCAPLSLCVLAAAALGACRAGMVLEQGSPPAPDSGTPRGGPTDGGTTPGADSGSGPGVDSGTTPGTDGGPAQPFDAGGITVTQVDGGIAGLPQLPPLTHVLGHVRGDGVTVTFEPVPGALDYRIYELPAPGTVSIDSNGVPVVQNALYRCAGDRWAPRLGLDGVPVTGVQETLYAAVNSTVQGFARTTAQATLGHVWIDPGPNRLPVWQLGNPDPAAENVCYSGQTRGQVYTASRQKTYATSQAQHDQLVAQGWRDDGIVFYVPAPGTGGTVQVSTTQSLWFSDPAEVSARSGAAPAFLALAAPGPDTEPLMRVNISGCLNAHDELVAGQARFDRVAHQGNQPVWQLQWPGLTGPTTLVVEALDQGCPFQGNAAMRTTPSTGHDGGWGWNTLFTVDDLRALNPHGNVTNGEVFLNGQHDLANRPKAVARSFLNVSPGAPDSMDWFVDFSQPESFTYLSGTVAGGFDLTLQSPHFDVSLYNIQQFDMATPPWPALYALGTYRSELWTAFSDWGADTNGKLRMTARQSAALSASGYLHVTMEVDSESTDRRYPQIIVSTATAPVQDNLPSGVALVLESFIQWPTQMRLQVCNHTTWDVNNQCPHISIYNENSHVPIIPQPVFAELGGFFNRTRWDLFMSTQKAYVFYEGQPMGCAVLPQGVYPAGPVSVTFGDVQYHSAVDWFWDDAMNQYSPNITEHHYDNLGFSSNVPQPSWDESIVPCGSALIP